MENIDIDIDIDKDNLKNIDIDIDMAILENIDIDKGILQNIDIDKISYRLGFGISNTPRAGCANVGQTSNIVEYILLLRSFRRNGLGARTQDPEIKFAWFFNVSKHENYS